MGEPHSGQRASAIGVLAEVRKSITSADTDFSIGGIAGLSSLIRISSRSILERRPRVSFKSCPITIFVNRVTVFIGVCGFKADSFLANRADRESWG